MSEYVDFHYMPLEGKITGKQVLKQTEDAINDLGNKVYSLDIDQSEIDEAIEKSNEAINTANSALSAVTTGRSVWFNNVDEMVATDIEAGVTAETKGYYVANDGGNALYLIRQEKSGDVVDGGSLIALDNGNMAELVTDGTVNVKQFGAIGNGTDDDTTVFQNTSSYAQANGFVPFVGVATYKITSNITGTFNSFGEVTITGGGTVDIINLQEVVSDVSDIRDEVVDETASAKAYSESAATSATSATNTANALINFLETKETLTAPAVDPTLTISGAAADAQSTGNIIKSIANGDESISITIPITWVDGGRRSLPIDSAPAVDGISVSSQIYPHNPGGAVTLVVDYDFKCLVATWNADGTYNSIIQNFFAGTKTITINHPYFCLEVRNLDDSALDASDMTSSDVQMSSFLTNTNLVNRDSLESNISALAGLDGLKTFTWEIGSRRNRGKDAGTDGDTITLSSDVVALASAEQKITINAADGYKYIVVTWKTDGTYNRYTPGSYLTGENTITLANSSNDYYYCIEVRKSDNSTISETDFPMAVYVMEKSSSAETQIITLTEDRTTPLNITKNTILRGNGHAIDIGTHLADTMTGFSDGILEVPFATPDPGTHLYKVFVGQTENLTTTSGTYTYNTVTVYAVSDDLTQSVNLTPYLLESDVRANDLSFTYDGTKFIIHIDDTTPFSSIVMCADGTTGVSANCPLFSNGFDVEAYNVRFLFGGYSAVYFKNGNYKMVDCEFGYSKAEGGFQTEASNGECLNCVAHHVGGDGFNYHYGYTHQTINCTGIYCGDDGISHHEDETSFTIIGGEWAYCGKGGIASPAAGSFGEIHNVYCHHNPYGILPIHKHNTPINNNFKVRIYNAILTNNNVGLQTAYHTITKDCTYADNNSDTAVATGGSLIEY